MTIDGMHQIGEVAEAVGLSLRTIRSATGMRSASSPRRADRPAGSGSTPTTTSTACAW